MWYMTCDDTARAKIAAAPAEIRRYLQELVEDGVTVIPRAVSESTCDEIVGGVNGFIEANAGYFGPFLTADGHYPRLVNLHLAHTPLTKAFSGNPLALALQDYLFGAETVIYTTLYYESGSSQSIHRDTPYFCTRPEYCYLGVWVALEDADEQNGCLEVVRRGHLLPELDREAMARKLYGSPENVPAMPLNLFALYNEEVNKQAHAAGLSSELVRVKKGDTVIWHPQTPHGGSRIHDPLRTRHSLVMHTVPIGVPVFKANVFFHPSRPLPETMDWQYRAADGRKFIGHATVDVAHQSPRPWQDFVGAGA